MSPAVGGFARAARRCGPGPRRRTVSVSPGPSSPHELASAPGHECGRADERAERVSSERATWLGRSTGQRTTSESGTTIAGSTGAARPACSGVPDCDTPSVGSSAVVGPVTALPRSAPSRSRREGHRARIHPVRHPPRRDRHPGHASRSTSARACPGSTSSACPTPACRESRDRVPAAVMSAGHDVADEARSPSTWRRRASARSVPGSTWRSPSACSSPPSSSRPTAPAGSGSSASSASTARCGGCRAWRRWSRVLGDVDAVVPAVSAAEAHVAARQAVHVATTLDEVVAALRGEAPWPDDRRPVRRRRRATASRPGRRPRPARRPPGARDRRRRRPPPAPRRSARLRQDDARPAPRAACCRRSTATTPSRPRWSTRRPGCRCRPAGSCARPPFRAPHHTSSTVALVGGGSATLRPGEISLSHGGVLFLDELGEFAPAALDGLREPLEEGVIRVSRAHGQRRAAGPVPARRGHQPVPVRRRAARLVRVRRRAPGCATCAGCPGRCSTASTCASRCSARRSTTCCSRAAVRTPPRSPRGCAAARTIALERSGRLNAALPRRAARRRTPR